MSSNGWEVRCKFVIGCMTCDKVLRLEDRDYEGSVLLAELAGWLAVGSQWKCPQCRLKEGANCGQD